MSLHDIFAAIGRFFAECRAVLAAIGRDIWYSPLSLDRIIEFVLVMSAVLAFLFGAIWGPIYLLRQIKLIIFVLRKRKHEKTGAGRIGHS